MWLSTWIMWLRRRRKTVWTDIRRVTWYMSLWWQLHRIATSQGSCKTCNLHDFYFFGVFVVFFVVEISQGFSLHLSISKLPHTDITFAPHLVCWHFFPLINTPAEMMGLLVGGSCVEVCKECAFLCRSRRPTQKSLEPIQMGSWWVLNIHLISGMFKD